ncbi:single-stranded DNA-binding protein [Streptosporangium sp. NPDC050855]|uniref:single-stranded DNA-binding protein n=1 Tax=Streptosporangium sp. NPDC050855 TaxID=3366194 RepID=UPI0037A9C7B7
MPTGQTTLTIIGNLTNDPEISQTKDGAAMCRFTIASNPRFYEQSSGTWRDGDPLFLRCTAWRHLAENIDASLTRGQRVIATGVLRQFEWTDAEGIQRTGYGLEIEDIGPSLRWATTTPTRRTSANRTAAAPSSDPWVPARATSTVNGSTAGAFSDEPPF